MSFAAAGGSLLTQLTTCTTSWSRILDVLLPQVDVLLQATVLWVVLRLRGTSRDELSTLSSLITSVQRSSDSPGTTRSARRVRAPKKS
jgi:hypothetical protein